MTYNDAPLVGGSATTVVKADRKPLTMMVMASERLTVLLPGSRDRELRKTIRHRLPLPPAVWGGSVLFLQSSGAVVTICETVVKFAALARSKADFLMRCPAAFLVSSAMAGAYVGAGILLIFSIGQSLDPSVRGLAMGASFGIALILVVFAGAELFTGYTMYMVLGALFRTTSLLELVACCLATWLEIW